MGSPVVLGMAARIWDPYVHVVLAQGHLKDGSRGVYGGVVSYHAILKSFFRLTGTREDPHLCNPLRPITKTIFRSFLIVIL